MTNPNFPNQSFHEDAEIRSYSVTKWRTLLSLFQENIRLLVKSEDFRAQISIEYIANLGDRWRELQRTQLRLSFILFSLIILVGTIGSGIVDSILIFGIRLSNQNSALALFLLVSSILMFFTSCLSVISNQYEALIKSLINSLMDEELAKHYIQQFSWTATSIFAGYDVRDRHWSANLAIMAIVVMLLASLFFATLTLIGLQLYIFASSVLFVYENPKLPAHLNMPIVLVATSAFLFSIAELLLRLPLPYADKSNMERLKELENSDPERANAIWSNIASQSLKKEKRNVIALQTTVVVLTIVSCELFTGARDFLENYAELIPIALSAVVFAWVISPLLDKYENRVIVKGTEVENKELRVYIYMNNKKKILRVRLAVACAFGIGLCLWMQ